MNCKKCGNPLVEGDLVCRNCGEPVAVDTTMVQQPVQDAVQQPTGVVQAPVQDAVQQPVGVVQPPVQDVVQQPTGVVQAPVQDTVQQPVGVVQPPVQDVVQQPTGVVQAPVQDVVQQPMGVVQPPVQDVVQQPVGAVQQPVQDTVMSQQQVFEQQMAQQSMQQQPAQGMPSQAQPVKKGKSPIFIVIILLCLVAIGVLVYFVFFNKSADTTNNNTDSTPSTVSNEESTTTTDEGSNTVATKENQVEVSGYTVSLPDGFQYEFEEDKIFIIDANKTMLASFAFYSTSIDEIRNNVSTLEAEFKKEVGDVVYSTEVFKNTEFLNFRYAMDGLNVNSFFVKYNNEEIVQGTIVEGKNYDAKTAFGYMVDIIDSASGDSKASSFSAGVPKINENNKFLQGIK